MSEFYSSTDHFVVLPAIMLALFGCAVMLFEPLFRLEGTRRLLLLWIAMAGLAFTGWALAMQQRAIAGGAQFTAFNNSLVLDGFSMLFNWVFLFSAAIVLL